MKNTRTLLEAKIGAIEEFELPTTILVTDTEYNIVCEITDIENGMLIGNEQWDGQTGDAIELAPANCDLDSLIYIAKLLEPKEGLAYIPDATDPKDELISRVIFLIQQDIELGDFEALAELLAILPEENLKNYLPE